MAEEKIIKVKKKKWIQIISPPLFRNDIIGEIPVSEPKSLIRRIITVNLASLTRDIKRQNTSIKLTITDIQGDRASTEFYGYYINPTSTKRLVRRGKEKIGLSATFKSSDNKKIRVMPIIIPPIKVKGSVASAFNKGVIEYLSSYTAKTTFDDTIKDLIVGKLQKDLKSAIKKIYPVRILEIAKLHIEREKKTAEKEVTGELKEEVKEKEEEKTPKEEENNENPKVEIPEEEQKVKK